MIMQESLFHELRIKEQLGYNVSCFRSPGGFNIAIYSPASKFTTNYIDERINNFLKKFSSSLKQMSQSEFNDKKSCFIKVKRFSDVSLKDEVERNWFILSSFKNFFLEERLEKDVLTINNLKIEELRQWFDDHFIQGKNFRKFSVQVVGNNR